MKPVRLPAEAKEQIEDFKELQRELDETLAELRSELRALREEADSEVADARQILESMIEDRVAAVDVVAGAWADYEDALASTRAAVLEEKERPAMAAASELRKKGKRYAALRREAKHARWLLELYEWNFPWLADLRDEGTLGEYFASVETEPQVETEDDPVSRWITRDEYASLSSADRNQRALDRYLKSRKASWQVGRDYERFIGYLREQEGCKVSYFGIFEGLDDLGRDLLAEKGDELEVIQCKRWSAHKTIHEKHVFQLFGTVVAARIEHPKKTVTGTFTTSTKLSDRARRFADELEIKVEQEVPLREYPRIKCNIGRGGERIYHLPFDQQYDTTIIEPERGERWESNVAEAERAGFRRAWRWRATTS